MSNYRSSFSKTIAVAAALSVLGVGVMVVIAIDAVVAAGLWSVAVDLFAAVGTIILIFASGYFCLVATGGVIALRRDSLEKSVIPYANFSRREWTPTLAIWLKRLLSGAHGVQPKSELGLYPGEHVEIRSLEDILQTLDERGFYNGMPFMPEMAKYCGQRARVFRRIDKLHDWVKGTGLKRMLNMVLLEDLRCNGTSHGGCQANCHLRWAEAWLRRVGAVDMATSSIRTDESHPSLSTLEQSLQYIHADGRVRYICQATELTEGGAPLRWGDPRHYMRDLVKGNVRMRPFIVGIALACFNRMQKIRGGVPYPSYSVGETNVSPHEALSLQKGERVTVKSKREIERTLNNRSRNRGLWFDRDMLRFSGGEYLVKARLERVINEKTGELTALTNPCIVLDGVVATGEYLAFNPENEYIFWREIWLSRLDDIGHESEDSSGLRLTAPRIAETE
jgi:hypothetical protein